MKKELFQKLMTMKGSEILDDEAKYLLIKNIADLLVTLIKIGAITEVIAVNQATSMIRKVSKEAISFKINGIKAGISDILFSSNSH